MADHYATGRGWEKGPALNRQRLPLHNVVPASSQVSRRSQQLASVPQVTMTPEHEKSRSKGYLKLKGRKLSIRTMDMSRYLARPGPVDLRKADGLNSAVE
ncbi:hypothetical protein UY3_17039 [Chelonia mydas]|uniref:Uncharacterized protein n=1 Tax=Chelonia mydas TaxID=8469 RepID=M7AMZ9_CHEMY|nr:hypothetical protein UY3_17039 [Chelonia mydas]